MDSRKLSLCLFSSLICLCSVFFLSADAAADEFVEVALTPQQTLALYGASFDAFYYNGSAVEQVTFDYYTSSSEIAEAVGDAHNFAWLSANWNNPDSDFVADFRATNFLVYRWITSSVVNSANTGYQFSIQPRFSISLSGLSSYKQRFMWSLYPQYSVAGQDQGRSYLYLDTSADSSPVPFASYNSGENWAGQITTYVAPILNNTYRKGLFFIDAEYYPDLQANFAITGQTLNLKNVDCYDAQVTDSSGAKAVYLFVSCPVLSDGFEIGSGSGSEDDPSGDINVNVDVDLSGVEADLDTIIENQETIIDNQETANEYLDGIYTTQTNQLNQIIAQLDAIYDAMASDGDFTVNINAALNNQTNALILGIQNLFIPTQAQLINFRMSLESELHSLFPAAFSSEEDMVSLFQRLSSVEAQSQIWFPGVSVGFADHGQQTQFEVPGQWVDLKPEDTSRGFQALYEAAALAVDIIATILFLNMLRNKFEGMMKPDGGD